MARSLEDATLAETDRRLEVAARLLEDIALPALGAAPPDPAAEGALRERVRHLGRQTGVRLTIVAASGRVVADSEEDPARMGNHADRPEIRAADATGLGTSSRFSHTVERRLRYLALPVRTADGTGPDRGRVGWVRTSVPLVELDERLHSLRLALLAGAAAAAALALGLALFLARRITRPVRTLATAAEDLAAGVYGHRVEIAGPGELRDLADAFNTMSHRLEASLGALEADRNKLEAILSSMVEGVIAVDRDERIVHLNRVAGKILGQDPEKAIGRPIWEVARSLPILESLSEAVQSEETVHRVARLSQREERWLDLRACPLRAGSAGPVGAVLVLDDVTQLRRLETIRRDFVANVSHELKTPIAAIQGLVETLLDHGTEDPEVGRDFLGRILKQSRRVGALVADLLSLSRLEAESGRVEAEPVDLRDTVGETLRTLAPAAEQRAIVLDADLPPEPLVVLGDAEALRQALSNLLDNAIKYSPEGSCVSVRAVRSGRRATVEVIDEGIGIDVRHQERIFERFYRVDKARSREVGGTGLGLAIVKHTALAMGGEVAVESAPGAGSTFRIELPLADSTDTRPPRRELETAG